MARLCAETPLPIGLDEELIGVNDKQKKIELLDSIRPQYIVLKPSLHGGMAGTKNGYNLLVQDTLALGLLLLSKAM